jgi:hypothetical protein
MTGEPLQALSRDTEPSLLASLLIKNIIELNHSFAVKRE